MTTYQLVRGGWFPPTEQPTLRACYYVCTGPLVEALIIRDTCESSWSRAVFDSDVPQWPVPAPLKSIISETCWQRKSAADTYHRGQDHIRSPPLLYPIPTDCCPSSRTTPTGTNWQKQPQLPACFHRHLWRTLALFCLCGPFVEYPPSAPGPQIVKQGHASLQR